MSVQFVQTIEDVAIIPTVENGGDDIDQLLPFSYYYTDEEEQCELVGEGECTEDGIIWRANDFGAPNFCHSHYFPQEQLGYEFIEYKEA